MKKVAPSEVKDDPSRCLLNPMHPDFRAIVARRAERFVLDPRMWR